MFVALFIIIGLSLLILGHEAGHFFAARFFKLKIDEFGFGFPPRIFTWRPRGKKEVDGTLRQAQGETEYSFNWLPFGGFVRIAGENDRISGNIETLHALPEDEKKRLFLFQPAWKRFAVLFAGVLVNFLIGWVLLSSVLMIGTPRALLVSDIEKGSPAEEAGIRPGDVIKNYSEAEGFIQFVDVNRGKLVKFEVKRGTEDVTFSLVPRSTPPPGEGAMGVVLAEAGEKQYPFFAALWEGLNRAALISWWTLLAFYDLIKSLFLHATLPAGVVGPVGIFAVAQETGKLGLIYLVQLVSLISINLAVINLLPFPALDGGRLLLLLIEKLKGSPISLKLEAMVNGLGFAFLLFLMAILTVRDIARWF